MVKKRANWASSPEAWATPGHIVSEKGCGEALSSLGLKLKGHDAPSGTTSGANGLATFSLAEGIILGPHHGTEECILHALSL